MRDSSMLTIWLTIGLDMVVIFAAVALLRRRQRVHGPLNPNLVAAVTSGLVTVVILSLFLPLVRINPRIGLAFIFAFLGFAWLVGFPVARWLYRQLHGDE